MNNNQINLSDLVDYIALLLNFEIKGKLIYLDVVQELETIKDLSEFRKTLKERVGNLNDDYKFLNGFQKFTKIVEEYKKSKVLITDTENINIHKFVDKLYSKLTWYFDELAWKRPTEEQIKVQQWKNHKAGTESLFNQKELKVCDELGDNLTIYRMATKNKPQLRDEILNVVTMLTITKKKNDLVALGNSQNKMLR